MTSELEKLIEEKHAFLDKHEFKWDSDKAVKEYKLLKLVDLANKHPEVRTCIDAMYADWSDYQDQVVAVYDGNFEAEMMDLSGLPEDGVSGYVITGNAKFGKGPINVDFGGCLFFVLGDLMTSLVIVSDSEFIVNGVMYASEAALRRYNDSTFSCAYTKTPLWIHFDGYMDPGLGHQIDVKLSEADDGFNDTKHLIEEDALICSECIYEQVELSGYNSVESFVKNENFKNWLATREPCEECDDISGVWDVSDEYWIVRLLNNMPIIKLNAHRDCP